MKGAQAQRIIAVDVIETNQVVVVHGWQWRVRFRIVVAGMSRISETIAMRRDALRGCWRVAIRVAASGGRRYCRRRG